MELTFKDYRASLGIPTLDPETNSPHPIPDHAERAYDPPENADYDGEVRSEYIPGKGYVWMFYLYYKSTGWWRWETRNH